MNDTPRTSEAELREKVRELMNDTRIAMLTSVDTDGTLVSRPMGTQEVVEDGDVWFITTADSDIVDEHYRFFGHCAGIHRGGRAPVRSESRR